MGQAAHLVAPLGRRWLHVQAVARAAIRLAATVPESDRSDLVSAAWLHDIGYSPKLAETGFHPLDGARYLRDIGWPRRIVNLVAHHSGARFEAQERGLIDELSEFELEESPVMDALVTADLTTGPSGESLTFQERIAEIFARYPSTDPVHRTWLKAAGPMEVCVQRALVREH
ncbi:HD domain-containing protein [Amycolatopsis suaedae]|uniref:HD domain-containing protein n=2 Tax=Amycolatopsis suaedae TaxID=2510978 RepID=A0A4Q7J6Q6_9PSEU|nr:HD domain-containing protein [Amycolatopsis suaedae]